VDEALTKERFEHALEHHRPVFGEFFLARFLGLQVSYGDQTCRVDLPTAEYMYNPQGSLHGGVIAIAMDVSMGHLNHRFLRTGVTLEMKTQFLRPVTGPCWCEARFTKTGRRVVFSESKLYDDRDRLCAVATATWMLLDAPDADGVGNETLRGGPAMT
jgi:uncharacterized protein (TIGR00369 family)